MSRTSMTPVTAWTDPDTGIGARAADETGARFVAGLAEAYVEHRRRVLEWQAELVADGIGIAHPDDGWVDRERNVVVLAYPTYQRTQAAPGVRVALGTPDRWRVVEFTHEPTRRIALGAPCWAFRPVENVNMRGTDG